MLRRLALLAACSLLPLGCATSADPSRTADASDGRESVPRPDWQVGDRWVFRWRAGLESGELTTVIAALSETGFTQHHGSEHRHFTPDGELISKVRNGRVTEQFSPPLPLFRFPLQARMRWQQGDGMEAAGGT